MSRLEKELENKDLIPLSFSTISGFVKNGPSHLIKKPDKKGRGLNFGTMVSYMLQDELTKESTLFKDNFVVLEYEAPTNTLLTLADYFVNLEIIPCEKQVLEVIKNLNLWANVKKEEILIKNFDLPVFWEYLKLKINHKDKTLISHEDHEDAILCVKEILSNKHTKHLFENTDFYLEYYFTYEFNGVLMRGFIDLIIIDHKNKTITFIDFKTGVESYQKFYKSFLEYRYDLQGHIYLRAANEVLEKLNLSNYTINNFYFLYIGRKQQIPILYEYDKKWYDLSSKGFTTHGGYFYKGFEELVEEIKFHFKTGIFDLDKVVIENNGLIEIKKDFIRLND